VSTPQIIIVLKYLLDDKKDIKEIAKSSFIIHRKILSNDLAREPS
jgi:hypothetical protein